MEYRVVTAVVRPDKVDDVEARLEDAGIRGLTVTDVRGTGESWRADRPDPKLEHVRLEVFTSADRADEVVETIVAGAFTGEPGDGVIAVAPASRVVRIRDQEPPSPEI